MQVAHGWEQDSPELSLGETAVHLWLITVPTEMASLPSYRAQLTGEERERADRFHFMPDRARYTLGRAVMRMLLTRYLGTPNFSLATNQYGKPLLASPANSLQFNLAHSGDVVLLGFARGRAIGVDVEHIRPDFATTEVAERFFAPDEAAVVAALPQPERADGFFQCWTRKEAYIKARGMGLSLPLHSFSVTLKTGEEPALLRVDGDPAAPGRWTILDLATCDDYRAAAAFEGRDLQVARYRWGTNPS